MDPVTIWKGPKEEEVTKITAEQALVKLTPLEVALKDWVVTIGMCGSSYQVKLLGKDDKTWTSGLHASIDLALQDAQQRARACAMKALLNEANVKDVVEYAMGYHRIGGPPSIFGRLLTTRNVVDALIKFNPEKMAGMTELDVEHAMEQTKGFHRASRLAGNFVTKGWIFLDKDIELEKE